MVTALLCAVFFLSGASALIFETVWFRQAGLAFGNSVWAGSLVLAGFMGGLALGNALAARFGDRLRNAVRAYAYAELAIAVTGVGLVYLLPALGVALAPWLRPLLDDPWLLNTLRLLFAFLLLLIPSTAMGVTLPLLTRTFMAYDPRFGSVLGRLYGWNTLGAVTGAIVGEVYLTGAFGVRGAALTAGALNVIAAGVAWWLSTGTPVPSRAAGAAGPARAWKAGSLWLAAAGLAGFALLALEVVWFRFLLLFVKGHSLAFALMLGIVLAGIATGGLAAAFWLRRSPEAHRFAAPISFSAGLLAVISYAAFPAFVQPLAPHLITTASEILRIGIPLMFPVSFLSGIFFTLAGTALRAHLASETETTGILTLANTAGAALGSLAAGFFLLPVLGVEKSFFAIAVLYGGLGGLILFGSAAPRRVGYAGAAVLVASLAVFPFGSMERRLVPISVGRSVPLGTDARIVSVREGLTETSVSVQRLMLGKPHSSALLTNAFSMSGTTQGSRRYMKLYVYWPMAVHPDLKRVLLIGFGVGNTAKVLTDSKGIERIEIAELSRDILEMSRVLYPDSATSPLHDPRVRVHVEDGRYFLQTTDQRFDLITGEPPPPGIAGVENLYSREYFRLIHDRLAEGGIVTYWLPLHSLADASSKAILRAFCDVFEDCSLWNGYGLDLMMVGTRNARGPVAESLFVRQWQDPRVAAELEDLGLEQPEQLGALFIGDAAFLGGILADAAPLVDDDPKRIEAPLQSREEAARLLRSFSDATAARDRFRQSPMIAGLWPERLRAGSLACFEVQHVINAQYHGVLEPGPASMEVIHGLLTQSTLKMPVVWLLGSDSDIQRVVANARGQELEHPIMQYHLGIGRLAERNFAGAVEPFRLAERVNDAPISQNAFRLRTYALAMSGQGTEAQRLARESISQFLEQRKVAPESIQLPPFWIWMKKTFGIDPLARNAAPSSRPGAAAIPAGEAAGCVLGS
jgi:spermidine synthase